MIDQPMFLLYGIGGICVALFFTTLIFYVGRFIWKDSLSCGSTHCPLSDSRVSRHRRLHWVLQSVNVLFIVLAVVSGVTGYIGLVRWSIEWCGGWGLLIAFVLTAWVIGTFIVYTTRDR